MPDWYRDHALSPEAYPDSEYLGWAQDQGLRVDAAGNVTDPAEDPRAAGRLGAERQDGTEFYDEIADDDVTAVRSEFGTGLDTWEF